MGRSQESFNKKEIRNRKEKKRKDKEKQFKLVLRNMHGDTEIVKTDALISELGARFQELSSDDKKSLGIKSGIRITSIARGKLRDDAKLKEKELLEEYLTQVTKRKK